MKAPAVKKTPAPPAPPLPASAAGQKSAQNGGIKFNERAEVMEVEKTKASRWDNEEQILNKITLSFALVPYVIYCLFIVIVFSETEDSSEDSSSSSGDESSSDDSETKI